MKKLFTISLLVVCIYACKQKETLSIPEGFTKLNDSIFYLFEKENKENKLTGKEAVVLSKRITNAFDMEIPIQEKIVKSDTVQANLQTTHKWLKLFKGKIHEGDSLIVAIPAADFFRNEKLNPTISIAPTELIFLHLTFSTTQKNTQVRTEKGETYPKDEKQENEISNEQSSALKEETTPVATDEFEKETFTLRYFLEYTHPEWLKNETEPGFFIHITKKGKGETPKYGDIVSIDYVGRFAMNGKKFDDSSFNPEPFEFVMGKPDQLLKGIEKAIYKLHEGGRAEIYFTSKYGYGANGSSTGIVGKYKSLTFAVHLKKIRKK